MSYVNTKVIVEKAFAEGYAVPAFNTQGGSYDICRAIIEAAELEHSPVILMAYETNLGYMGFDGCALIGKHLAEKCSSPVALHLDHASSIEMVKKAVDAGFSSVMIDYSKKSVSENIAVTNEVIAMLGKNRWVSVEAELGELQRIGEDDQKEVKNLVDPKDVQFFLEHASPDMLAVGIGNAHGFYKGEPEIRLDLLAQVREISGDTPLVLHGSTGIADEIVKQSISDGIAKVNFGTLIRYRYIEYYREHLLGSIGTAGHSWKVSKAAVEQLVPVIRDIMKLCGSSGKV